MIPSVGIVAIHTPNMATLRENNVPNPRSVYRSASFNRMNPSNDFVDIVHRMPPLYPVLIKKGGKTPPLHLHQNQIYVKLRAISTLD